MIRKSSIIDDTETPNPDSLQEKRGSVSSDGSNGSPPTM